MKKIGLGIIAAVVVAALAVGVAFALPPSPQLPDNDGTGKAEEVSPAIDDERNVTAPPEVLPQPPESDLTAILFIRYAPGFQKDKPCDNDGVCDPDEKGWCSDCKGGGEEPTPTPTPTPTTSCYAFFSTAKPSWKKVENYYYSDSLLAVPSANAIATWEGATSGDIFGTGQQGIYPWGVYDGYNSISFYPYPEEGVLGAAWVWYQGGRIWEYDIMLDTDYFPVGPFDLGTVVLHELGHAAGLDDLYDTACASEVMYGYLSPGEVKASLGAGDTAGIQILYGP